MSRPGFTVAQLYEGADGLTLLLRTSSVGSIERLQQTFTRLADNPGLRLDLCDEIGTPIHGVIRVILECDEGVGDFDKSLRVKRVRKATLPSIEWRRGASGWQWCAELMQPLIDHEGSGHQYLSQSLSDDAGVEVDFVVMPEPVE